MLVELVLKAVKESEHPSQVSYLKLYADSKSNIIALVLFSKWCIIFFRCTKDSKASAAVFLGIQRLISKGQLFDWPQNICCAHPQL